MTVVKSAFMVIGGMAAFLCCCVVMVAAAQTIKVSAPAPVASAQLERFVVVSQQYVDSGAKVIVLRDLRRPKACYVIYEAGAGTVLDKDVPCE